MMQLGNTSANDTTPAPEHAEHAPALDLLQHQINQDEPQPDALKQKDEHHGRHREPKAQQQGASLSSSSSSTSLSPHGKLEQESTVASHLPSLSPSPSPSLSSLSPLSNAQSPPPPPPEQAPISASHPSTPTSSSLAALPATTTSDTAADTSEPTRDGENATISKKRKRPDAQPEARPRSVSRPPSPPWKKFGAEGPTAFLEDGKRRSGRVNVLPLELQAPSGKRKTRSTQQPQAMPAKSVKKENVTASVSKKTAVQQPQPAAVVNVQQQTPASRKEGRLSDDSKPVAVVPTKQTSQKSTTKTNGVKADKPAKKEDAQDVTMEDGVAAASSPARKTSSRLRKLTQNAQDQSKAKPASTPSKPAQASPRITLKLRRTEASYFPQHPSHIPPAPPQSELEDALVLIDLKEKEQEKTAKIDENYQGLERLRAAAERDRDPELTLIQAAEKEARTRLRILEAAEPGGPLSEEKSSLYLPDEQSQPPAQYSHLDHIWSQASYFRLLLDREKRTHVEQAKKMAYAAMAKWKEKQPQTDEEKERQERAFSETVYRQLVKDVGRKWELVGEEINRRRHAKWEIEEKKRREKRMQEVMERSTNLLDARKAARESREESLLSVDSLDENDYEDTETPNDRSNDDEDDDDDNDDDAEREDSDVMSDSDDDSEEDANADPDANLSPEALRRKYSTLPDLPQSLESLEPLDDMADNGSDMDVDEALADMNDTQISLKHPSADSASNPETPAEDMETPAEPERDYANVQLDEVDDALLDDSDESISMSDEDMTDEDDDDDEEQEGDGSDEDEDEDEEEDVGLMGFLGGRERRNMQQSEEDAGEGAVKPQCDHVIVPNQAVDDVARKSPAKQLVPPTSEQITAAQVPSVRDDTDCDSVHAPVSEAKQSAAVRHPSETNPDRNLLFADSHGEDRSSQLSVKDDTTAEPTEAESTTSIDMEDADKITQSNEQTPQPAHGPRTKIPSLLRGTLREYQHEGLDWLAKLYANKTNGILADEMGLGKTIQTIALLAHLAEEHQIWGPHLIVVPTSVILNWEMEFKKFLPGFKILSYYGTVEERAQKRKGWSNPDNYNVVITSYQLVLRDILAIKVPEWHYMILDEAHNIKNFNSKRYQAMIRLKTHARLLLTGTPLQNNIQELWSLLTFLTAGHDGQGMGELHEFEEWFSKPVNEIFTDSRQSLSGEAQKIVNKLHHSLRPYLLRRLKAHVEKQLPGKYEHTVLCRLSKRQRQLYDSFMGLSDTKAKLQSGNMVSVSMALMALRKVCNHPDLFEERPIVTSFAMPKPYSKMPRAAVADYETKDLIIRKRLMAEDLTSELDLNFLSLNLVSREGRSGHHVRRSRQLRATGALNEIARHQTQLLPKDTGLDGSSFASILAYQHRQASVERLDKIRKYAFLTQHRTDFLPVYGTDLVARATIRSANDRLSLQPPQDKSLHSRWYLDSSELIRNVVKTLPERAEQMDPFVRKFACITPNVVAENLLAYTTPSSTISAIRSAVQSQLEPSPTSLPPAVQATSNPDLAIDPFHESRMRLSIAFPDKRLLQYDCGKLQRLALLLRSLTSKGSRALIFTQMTAVLDILESFLNIHGYRYMRLDGSTRIEQRQDMMERFNRDAKIDVFILSSRSGGVGMNLTGADTVIFYDLDWNPQMDRQCQDRAHRIGQTRDVHIYKFVSESTIEVNILKKSNQKRLLDEVVIQEGEFTTDWFKRPDADDGVKALHSASDLEGDADDVAGAAVDKFFGQATGTGAGEGFSRVLEEVEDAEDVAAARGQQRELLSAGAVDECDFDENAAENTGAASRPGTKTATPRGSVPPTPSSLTALDGAATPSVTDFAIHGEGDVLDPALRKSVDVEAEKEEVVEKGDGKKEVVMHVDEYMLRCTQDFLLAGVMYVPPVDKKRGRLDKNGRDRSHRAKRIR